MAPGIDIPPWLLLLAAVVGWAYREVEHWHAKPSKRNGNDNGKTPSEDRVRLLQAEACQDCKQVQEIKSEIEGLRREYRVDFRALQNNVAIDIRGIHERLDDILLDRKVH
jgi:hypothetical protein